MRKTGPARHEGASEETQSEFCNVNSVNSVTSKTGNGAKGRPCFLTKGSRAGRVRKRLRMLQGIERGSPERPQTPLGLKKPQPAGPSADHEAQVTVTWAPTQQDSRDQARTGQWQCCPTPGEHKGAWGVALRPREGGDLGHTYSAGGHGDRGRHSTRHTGWEDGAHTWALTNLLLGTLIPANSTFYTNVTVSILRPETSKNPKPQGTTPAKAPSPPSSAQRQGGAGH